MSVVIKVDGVLDADEDLEYNFWNQTAGISHLESLSSAAAPLLPSVLLLSGPSIIMGCTFVVCINRLEDILFSCDVKFRFTSRLQNPRCCCMLLSYIMCVGTVR